VQQLHLVGFTTDQRGLIFSARRGAKSGSYTVSIDAALCDAIDEFRGASKRSTAVTRGTASRISVREVQSRLRRGSSISEVARTAGVDETWVERFASPVLAEQAEVIRTVREWRFQKPRLGPSDSPLGESVYRNLADRGVADAPEDLDTKWRARQVRDGLWAVTFHHAWRGRDHEVVWELDQTSGEVRAVGRLGADLAFRPGPSTPAPTRKRAPKPGPQLELALVHPLHEVEGS
jgi:hypothetical protein